MRPLPPTVRALHRAVRRWHAFAGLRFYRANWRRAAADMMRAPSVNA